MQQFREVSRTRTIYSTETHTSDFILNTFWNGKPVQFFQERCCVVMTGCQENKSCSKVLNFLERLDDRIRCTHKETVAVVKPWKDVGSNKSLGCVFSEKPADWTNAFKLEISSLADFYDVLLHGQFWVKNESKVPGRIREGDVVRAKSNRVREGNGRRFQGRRKGKEKSFCFVVVQFELIFRHPCFYVVCACIEFFGEVGHFIERRGFLELCVICEKLMVYRVVSYDIGERRSVQDEENGPQYWALRHTVHELWWWRRRVIDWSGLVPVWEVWVKPLECSRLNAKNRVQAGEENLVVKSVKSGRKIQQKKNRNVVIVQSGKNIVYNT